MRLLSATVRAYRLHQETTVVFDPQRTLIGGPNEAGKSTLAEAVHRALFFKAKGNTREHKLMKSSVHQGTPEVELSFEAGGGIYQLKKRFGASGETTLTPPRGAALTGEAAEAELACVLGVDACANTKMTLCQWAHLWVWQGDSRGDPTPHANLQRDSLLQRLQTLGGAAAMQSDQDSRTAAAVASAWGEIFTASGKEKANSPLSLAEAACKEANAAESAAWERAESLAESARNFTEAENQLTQFTRDVIGLSSQQEEALRQESLIRQYRAGEATEAAASQAADARRGVLEQQEAQVARIRRGLTDLEAELAPLDLATSALLQQLTAAQEAAVAAAREHEAANEAAALARQRQDLARAWLQQHESASRLEALAQRAAQVAEHQAETEKVRLELAALPPVDEAALASLQKLDAARHAAESALAAMAAGVEFIAGDATVRLGGTELTPGEFLILTEEAELMVGDSCRLRIRPGGGTSLTETRERQQSASRQCQAALGQAGVGSVDEAVLAAARRTGLTARFMAGQSALQSLKSTALPGLLAEAQADHAKAAADTTRRAAALGPEATALNCASPEAARAALREFVTLCGEGENAVTQAKARREAAQRVSAAQAEVLIKHRDSLRERQQRHTGLLAQQELLLTNHGSDEDRLAALAVAVWEQSTLAAALARTRQVLESLQPEHNERTLDRLKRGLGLIQQQRSEAEMRRAVAADRLKSDGSHDPAEALAMATARAVTALETVARLRRQASARQLLHATFMAEQAALAERFTQPLADRISGYLECLFGPGARAEVVIVDQAFDGLKIQRPGRAGGSIPFDSLSGGTQEQCAAAVRLAMAEVLAADHHGTLPVLFDDAFAYSDAARLGPLIDMLDLAASRGLQILLLTHQPAEYRAFGAVTVMLE